MRDPYEILGLAKTASAAEIKSAYRKLAKKYHPDQSKEPKAKDKFAEIGSAYEIIGDEKKRGAFDRGEIDAEGKPRHPGLRASRAPAGAQSAARAARASNISNSISAAAISNGGRRRGRDRSRHSLRNIRRPGGRAGAVRPRRGEDVAVVATVPLALGGDRRLGAGDIADRQDARCRHSRRRRGGQADPPARPGPAGRQERAGGRRARHHPLRAASAVQGRGARSAARSADHALRGGARRQGSRADAGGRGRNRHSARRQQRADILRLRGKGLPAAGEAAQGDLLRRCASCCPRRAIPNCSALMRRWRDEKPYDPRASLT